MRKVPISRRLVLALTVFVVWSVASGCGGSNLPQEPAGEASSESFSLKQAVSTSGSHTASSKNHSVTGSVSGIPAGEATGGKFSVQSGPVAATR